MILKVKKYAANAKPEKTQQDSKIAKHTSMPLTLQLQTINPTCFKAKHENSQNKD